ncbi:phage head closure protein [Lachnospiraceae bacterium LCP25S3_G4]
MYNDIIKLVKIKKTVNEYGDITDTETEKIVFAELKSITQSEFYQAQSVGLKPEIKFTIADYYDYCGESIIRYKERELEEDYSVIRTYRVGNELEIVCKRGID